MIYDLVQLPCNRTKGIKTCPCGQKLLSTYTPILVSHTILKSKAIEKEAMCEMQLLLKPYYSRRDSIKINTPSPPHFLSVSKSMFSLINHCPKTLWLIMKPSTYTAVALHGCMPMSFPILHTGTMKTEYVKIISQK